MPKSKSFVFFIILTLVGLSVSIYLTFLYSQPAPIVCVTGCELVRESKYSNFLGISVPIWGVLFYFCVLAITFFKQITKHYDFLFTITLQTMLTAGFIFSLYLTFLELFVIEAICQWCVVSAICSTLLFLIHTKIFLIYIENRK
jgi:uncharacterized membrane protein